MTAKKTLPLGKKSHDSNKSVSKPVACIKKTQGKPKSLPPFGNKGSGKRAAVSPSTVKTKKSMPQKKKLVPPVPSKKAGKAKPPTTVPRAAVLKPTKKYQEVNKTKKKVPPKGAKLSSHPVRTPSKGPTLKKPTPTSSTSRPPAKPNKRDREDSRDRRIAKLSRIEVKSKKPRPSSAPVKCTSGKSTPKGTSKPCGKLPQHPRMAPHSRASVRTPHTDKPKSCKTKQTLRTDSDRVAVRSSLPPSEVAKTTRTPSLPPNVHVTDYTVAAWPLSTSTSVAALLRASGDADVGAGMSVPPADSPSAVAFQLSNTTYGVWFPDDRSCLQILTSPCPPPQGGPAGSCDGRAEDPRRGWQRAESCILYVNPAGHAMVFRLDTRGPARATAPIDPRAALDDSRWLLIPACLRGKFARLSWAGRWRRGLTSAPRPPRVLTELHQDRWWDPTGAPQGTHYEHFSFGIRVGGGPDNAKAAPPQKPPQKPNKTKTTTTALQDRPPSTKTAALHVPPPASAPLREQRWFIPYVCAVQLPAPPGRGKSGEGNGTSTNENGIAAATPRHPPSSPKGLSSREPCQGGGASPSLQEKEPCARFTLANTLARYPGDLFYIHPRERMV